MLDLLDELRVQNPAPPVTTARRTTSPTGRRWLLGLLAAYAALLAALSLTNLAGPERWWWGAVNLYLPQWLWGIPGAALLAITLRLRWKWAWAPAGCLLWVAGPLMGFCWSWPDADRSRPRASRLRVMTYNIKYGRDLPEAVEQVRRARPDLLLVQDVSDSMNRELGTFLRGWNVRAFGQYVIASRLPLTKPEVRWISFPGERHTCLRCEVTVSGEQVAVYDAHLLTPRRGLAALRDEADAGVGAVEDNTEARLKQATELADMVRKERGPVIVAGDLNAPPPSLVVRRLKSAGLHDSFAEAGRGYGYTYGHSLRFGHSFIRIDHILLSRGMRAISCRTGGADGSDHRPLIADVELAPAP